MGYRVSFKIDSIGLDNPGDTININVKYYALTNDNKLYPADIYIQGKDNRYRLLKDSDYKETAETITLKSGNRDKYQYEPGKAGYNTWNFGLYLPPTAKVVRKGYFLDLYRDNTFKYKLLTVLDISGKKSGTGVAYDYTANENNWGKSDGSIYGANRPTGLDLTGKGVNSGEAFWYNLFETALDDINIDRGW